MKEPQIELDLIERFRDARIAPQRSKDGIPTFWVDKADVRSVLQYLKDEAERPYRMLYDLTAIDERSRQNRNGQPDGAFTVVYHLLSVDRNEDIRIKTALDGKYPSIDTITHMWHNANWYEREVYDMFGIKFDGHPNLRRILMPWTWEGHPLRKEHPARATEMGQFSLPQEKQDREQEAMRFKPEEWGMKRESEDTEFMFLNLGPQHPGTHGVLRLILQIDGEMIVDIVPDIGFH
ncbi:MAG TPA: NADH-quinone oxidoreductase subunit C/D, partial [candidate division Zixibacteria bacterium]|nr:NADH-quinone oxidoreductase subunit C/D [candidate division Zixibacteria bacterium]